MNTGAVIAIRADGAVIVYDRDDEYGRPQGHIRIGTKTWPPRPVMALLARGGWTPEDSSTLTAGGESWRWQLRDREGQWIEMGSEVKWLARGRWKYGIVTGSPSPGIAEVEEYQTKRKELIAASRLDVVTRAEAFLDTLEQERAEKGRIDWRARALTRESTLAENLPEPEPEPEPEIPERVRLSHQPPEDSVTLDDLANPDIGTFPDDVYDHPEWYMHTATMSEKYERESLAVVRKARGKPDLQVTIYRAVPKNVTSIEPGDWVALSRAYAEQHGGDDPDTHVISATVPASSLRNGGNDLIEWGWFPAETEPEAPKIPEGPQKIASRDIKVGDVLQQPESDDPDKTIRVLKIEPNEKGDDYINFTAVILTGLGAGKRGTYGNTGSREVTRVSAGPIPDFDTAVIAPLKEKVAALRAKYPEGLARALDQAVTPQLEAAPAIRGRLLDLGNDPEIVRWDYDYHAAIARMRDLQDKNTDYAAIKAAEDEVRALSPYSKGGKFLEYDNLLVKHRKEYAEWQKANRDLDIIKPHTPEAQQILADVREIGQMARLGVDIEVVQRNATDPKFARLKTTEAKAQVSFQRRRELARQIVAEVVGTPDSTKQTWFPKVHNGGSGMSFERDLTPEERDAMTTGLTMYPATWVQRFDQVKYTTSLSTRGYHSDNDNHIALSNYDGKSVSKDGTAMWAAILHEEGHGMERLVPGLSTLEQVWWHDRMGELSPKKFHPEDGALFPNPDPNSLPEGETRNIARPTAQRYSLKMYGNVYSKSNKHWEVFTTGVQNVLGDGKTEYTSRMDPQRGTDADLWEFTMGALLGLDGRDVTPPSPARTAAEALPAAEGGTNASDTMEGAAPGPGVGL